MESSVCPERGPDELEAAVIRRAQERLARSPYSALGRVASSYRGGALELRGCLPSHYLKQIAQELVCRIEGVNDVINQIQVRVAGDLGPVPGDSTRGA